MTHTRKSSRTYGQHRGFTLLIAIILSMISLAIGLALADVAYKQVVLSQTAKQSQTAFYNADSALECALYYDQQFAAFNNGTSYPRGSILCGNRAVSFVEYQTPYSGGGVRTTFNLTCPTGGTSAQVTVYKEGSGTCSATGSKNCLYAAGYNVCNAGPNRFERGLKVVY